MSMSTNHPNAAAIWSNLLEATAKRQSFFAKVWPATERTPEEQAAVDAYRAQHDADESKVPAFLAALEALCIEHGVTIKAEVGDSYEGDDFRAYLGAARIESIDITPPSPEEPSAC